MTELRQLDETLWEIPAAARADMRVPARVFADAELLDAIRDDRSLEQLQNVATLPGIVDAALAMPDIHQGYGFPVGGVAATELPDGVVSPGGVGYDINCGVRLLVLPLSRRRARRAQGVARPRDLPARAGRRGRRRRARRCAARELDRVLRDGPRALVRERGHRHRGRPRAHRVARAGSPGADPGAVSERARERGAGPARHPRLGQPLPRGAGGRRSVLDADGRATPAASRRAR